MLVLNRSAVYGCFPSNVQQILGRCTQPKVAKTQHLTPESIQANSIFHLTLENYFSNYYLTALLLTKQSFLCMISWSLLNKVFLKVNILTAFETRLFSFLNRLLLISVLVKDASYLFSMRICRLQFASVIETHAGDILTQYCPRQLLWKWTTWACDWSSCHALDILPDVASCECKLCW